MSVVSVTASLNLKRDGGSTVDHYEGYWYSPDDPQHPLGTMRGSRDEVLAWANSLGAAEVKVSEPTAEVLAENARQFERAQGN